MTMVTNVPSMYNDKDLIKFLEEGGFINETQSTKILENLKKGKLLKQVLVDENNITMQTYAQSASMLGKVSLVDLKQVEVNPDAISLVPEETARRLKVFPYAIDRNGYLRVAIEEPRDKEAINQLQTITGKAIKVAVPLTSDIQEAIDKYYKPKVEPKPEIPLNQLRLLERTKLLNFIIQGEIDELRLTYDRDREKVRTHPLYAKVADGILGVYLEMLDYYRPIIPSSFEKLVNLAKSVTARSTGMERDIYTDVVGRLSILTTPSQFIQLIKEGVRNYKPKSQ